MDRRSFSRIFRIGLTRTLFKAFWLVPLSNRTIFFSAYEGKQYSCNPRAIYEKLREDLAFSDFRFVWELNDSKKRAMIDDPRARFVSHNSLGYFYAVMTSGTIITNTGITARLPLRKKQILMNTWHGGGAFKRVGYAIKTDMSGDLYELTLASRQTTYYLTSSRIFTDVMVDSIQMPRERFVPTGMPRNDVLTDEEMCAELRKKVLAHYGLSNEDYLVLYAPTYHGKVGEDMTDGVAFDVQRLCEAIKLRFGRKAVLLVRLHYYNPLRIEGDGVVFASDYPDMQELLAAADLLITDYSSSIWDYSLTRKPCILYTPDIDDYDRERGFYTMPETWPGILCKTEEELSRAIESWDEAAYRQIIDSYLKNAENYDTGEATDKAIELLKGALKQK